MTKFNATGSDIVYSIFFGGFGATDYGDRIAVDANGDAYISGRTGSTDFPTVAPIQGSCAACPSVTDAFVTRVNFFGNAWIFSTYLGGNGSDWGGGIAVDPSGTYVTGRTSSDYPTNAGAFDTIYGGGTTDVFVAKIENDLSLTDVPADQRYGSGDLP